MYGNLYDNAMATMRQARWTFCIAQVTHYQSYKICSRNLQKIHLSSTICCPKLDEMASPGHTAVVNHHQIAIQTADCLEADIRLIQYYGFHQIPIKNLSYTTGWYLELGTTSLNPMLQLLVSKELHEKLYEPRIRVDIHALHTGERILSQNMYVSTQVNANHFATMEQLQTAIRNCDFLVGEIPIQNQDLLHQLCSSYNNNRRTIVLDVQITNY